MLQHTKVNMMIHKTCILYRGDIYSRQHERENVSLQSQTKSATESLDAFQRQKVLHCLLLDKAAALLVVDKRSAP